MFDFALEGLATVLDIRVIAYALSGIVIGSVFAAIPGTGAVVPLSILLPFAVTLDLPAAIGLLFGIAGVSNTANSFPSILISVPGSSGSQATIVDGYPMAQQGQAARAFGAAFTASGIGALIGAGVLLVAIPVMRPLVLSLGSPELFMLVFWGLLMVGVLSSGATVKGILAAVLGLLVATVGMDDKSAVTRFTFGVPYLWDGIKLSLIGLGVFAVPELMAVAARGTAIAERTSLGSGTVDGIRDTIRNWFLVLRCSALGSFLGIIPGIGGNIVDWVNYAHGKQTVRKPEFFGRGDVRGVIAPESSNSSKDGGALIPTLAFGIPGSTGYALILSVLISIGVSPGPSLLSERLDVIFAIIYVLVLGAVVASVLCIGLAKWVAELAYLPYSTIVPLVIGIAVVAAYAASFSLWDLVVLFIAAVVGMLMKHFRWPRPPLVLAVVLGGQAEQYLWLSVQRYEFSWLLRPGVLILLVLVVATLFYPMLNQRLTQRRGVNPEAVKQ